MQGSSRRPPKRYDRAYFDRWYRSRGRVISADDVRRKVALAVTATEYFLHRRLRSVLDVACGEGAWFPHLKALRPRVTYRGIDPSGYAAARFGKTRHIRKGSFGDLPAMGLQPEFDLVICADVLHYLADDEIARGLPQLVRLVRGAAFLEVLTRDDEVVGDTTGMYRRPSSWYREVFGRAQLVQVGPFLWAPEKLVSDSAALERV